MYVYLSLENNKKLSITNNKIFFKLYKEKIVIPQEKHALKHLATQRVIID